MNTTELQAAQDARAAECAQLDMTSNDFRECVEDVLAMTNSAVDSTTIWHLAVAGLLLVALTLPAFDCLRKQTWWNYPFKVDIFREQFIEKRVRRRKIKKPRKPGVSKSANLSEGDTVRVNYKGRGQYYRGKIHRRHTDDTYDVQYEDHLDISGFSKTCVRPRWLHRLWADIPDSRVFITQDNYIIN